MNRSFLLILALVISVLLADGQEKKPLDFSEYDTWKKLSSHRISNNGTWVSYEINPGKGDGYLYLYNIKTGRLDSVARGKSAKFSPDNSFVAFRLSAPADTLRALELAGKKKDDLPKDTLCVWNLKSNQKTFFANIASFSMPSKQGNWLAVLFDKSVLPKDTTKKKFKSEGAPLLLFRPTGGDSLRLNRVTKYALARYGSGGYFIQSVGDSIEETLVHAFNADKWSLKEIFHNPGKSTKIATSDRTGQAAMLFSADTTKHKTYRLLYHNPEKQDAFVTIVDTTHKALDKDYAASENGPLYFSRNGSRLFFGVASRPLPEPKDTLTKDEKAKLDVWNWKDLRLQPMQKKQLGTDQKRTYLTVFYPSKNKVIQLGDEQLPKIVPTRFGNGDMALGYDDQPYIRSTSWSGKRIQDVYLVDVNTGERALLQQAIESQHGLSPDGRYFYWYAPADSNYHVMDNRKGKAHSLSAGISVPLYNDWHDAPSNPGAFGVAGWSSDNRYLLVYDRFDIWKLDASGKESARLLTHGKGREDSVQLRYQKLDSDELAVNLEKPVLLSAFNISNKMGGYYRFHGDIIERLVLEDASFNSPVKADNSDELIVRKGDFIRYPDLYLTNTKFQNPTLISHTNPQQPDYRWGDIRLVGWKGFNGERHQGLLVTPENMDTTLNYPMILYFYERSSDRLHNHYTPAPSRSTINWTFYASNGYVVFVPDITYRDGDPGLSAYEAIMSGMQSMLERYPFIDADNMGLQGQSWGGYQTAFMVTRTNRFKAAMAGAPVSNMTSAYGGIRWGTGMSRMFQYERTQSRIGATLWDALPKYIENSPLFFVPQIETPLLMMHNDNDGAVPWYQGIELFTAMRRLDRPVWMLVYNNEEHNLTRRANTIDLSRRMLQFFDHYLKGKPAPRWMEQGVSALDKEEGKQGFELIE